MKSARYCLTVLTALSVAFVLTVSGCGGGTKTEPKSGGGKKSASKSRGRKTIEVAGFGNLKGRVTYNGSGEPTVQMLKPTKDQDKCPAEVPGPGWYVKSDNKGVRYALVFLKPPKGARMPKPKSDALPEGLDEVVVIGQPHCQFEPRVVCLHPKQKIQFINDSDPGIAHDSNLSGATFNYTKTLPPGEKTEPIDVPPFDRAPYGVSCGIHTGFMSAFVWKMSHPWAVVTDADGNFEIKDAPVPKDGKMILAVWHEMLPGNHFMDIGEVDLKVGETVTKDIGIPNK